MADVVNPVLLRYANALYQLAAERGAGDVTAIAEQLDVLSSNLGGNDGSNGGSNGELAQHLGSPRVGREVKQRLLKGILGADVHDLVRRTVMLLVDKGRAGEVGGLAASFRSVSMRAEGRELAVVSSATALDDNQRRKLVEELQRLTGLKITLEETVDPELIGGLRVVLGSKMIDGSLSRRLESLGENLFRAPVGAGH